MIINHTMSHKSTWSSWKSDVVKKLSRSGAAFTSEQSAHELLQLLLTQDTFHSRLACCTDACHPSSSAWHLIIRHMYHAAIPSLTSRRYTSRCQCNYMETTMPNRKYVCTWLDTIARSILVRCRRFSLVLHGTARLRHPPVNYHRLMPFHSHTATIHGWPSNKFSRGMEPYMDGLHLLWLQASTKWCKKKWALQGSESKVNFVRG